MKNAQLIAFAGAKGSGKDTAAQALIKAFPDRDIRQIAFADPIKDEVMMLFNIKTIADYDLFKRGIVHYHLPNRPQEFVEGRHLVREIGMLMRRYDEMQFVDYVHLQTIRNPNTTFIVTDLRFDNELHMLQSRNAYLIKLLRASSDDDHITERGFDASVFDAVIDNTNITKLMFEQEVVRTYHKIIRGQLDK